MTLERSWTKLGHLQLFKYELLPYLFVLIVVHAGMVINLAESPRAVILAYVFN